MHRGRPPPSCLTPAGQHLAPHRVPSFRVSAGCVGVQPATELRHVQSHSHVEHVRRALRPACTTLPQFAVEPSPARCAPYGRPPPSGPHLAPHRCPPFGSWQQASAFDQPLSFDTSSVIDMRFMFWVRSSPCPAPNLCRRALPRARCSHRGRPPPPAPRPAPRPATHALLLTLGSPRRCSTSH